MNRDLKLIFWLSNILQYWKKKINHSESYSVVEILVAYGKFVITVAYHEVCEVFKIYQFNIRNFYSGYVLSLLSFWFQTRVSLLEIFIYKYVHDIFEESEVNWSAPT